MIAIHLDQVSVTYIAQPVFQQLSWEIHDNRVVGLVGPNGAGKSTLLRLVAGHLHSDTGYVNRSKELTVGYLPQEPDLDPMSTVWQEALTASTALAAVNRALTAVEAELGDPAVYGDAAKLAQVLTKQEHLLVQFEELGGAAYEGRVRTTLTQLGFASELARNLSVSTLSGGQKKLVGLAKLLITQPKILLLDEPDNHLDLHGKQLLEQVIRSYDGGVVIISHD
ncbi:MAG: ABC-F family ATP-binding cassette domain-containing protein, partial [Caldilineaceae bacterium]|nr:ABC-F family ATP-binding cassette domain-containing protein [Caldilineaceae bacterium]